MAGEGPSRGDVQGHVEELRFEMLAGEDVLGWSLVELRLGEMTIRDMLVPGRTFLPGGRRFRSTP